MWQNQPLPPIGQPVAELQYSQKSRLSSTRRVNGRGGHLNSLIGERHLKDLVVDSLSAS
jgi:hypothetical protein